MNYIGAEDPDALSRVLCKDVTWPVEFSELAVDPFGNTRVAAEIVTKISRKEVGLTWNAALEAGGVLVSDKVTLELDLSFIKVVED